VRKRGEAFVCIDLIFLPFFRAQAVTSIQGPVLENYRGILRPTFTEGSTLVFPDAGCPFFEPLEAFRIISATRHFGLKTSRVPAAAFHHHAGVPIAQRAIEFAL